MGSGVSGRRLAGPFRGILQFLLDLLALGPVAGAGLPAVADALGVAGQPPPAAFARGRVGFLGRGRVDARAAPPPLGRALQRRGLGLLDLALAALADQLGDRWQSLLLADCSCCSFNSTVSGVYSIFRPPNTQTYDSSWLGGRAPPHLAEKRDRGEARSQMVAE